MSDLKLFQINGSDINELGARSVAIEKSLQTLFEKHLESLLGVRFLATEYSTGKKHGGRIDTLGLDENGCPVIIEYKRATNENVINQGLFYLDWLMDHKADFEMLAMKKLGKDAAEEIEWSAPRLLCIAGDFTRYDEHAVQQMGRNIELIRYRRYGDDLLLLELVNAVRATKQASPAAVPSQRQTKETTVADTIESLTGEFADLVQSIIDYMQALGDDVQVNMTVRYIAFRRIKNFCCMFVRSSEGKALLFLKLDPNSVVFQDGFIRDVSGMSSYGDRYGNVEITVSDLDDFENAKPLLVRAYEGS
jgi:predicted transport protein